MEKTQELGPFSTMLLNKMQSGYKLIDNGWGWRLNKPYQLWKVGDTSIEVPSSVVDELVKLKLVDIQENDRFKHEKTAILCE